MRNPREKNIQQATTTLYEEVGGESAVREIVDDFYQRVLADDTVNQFFAHTDMEKQRRHQTAFISFALGGPKEYTGKSMETAHSGLNLQPEHFDAIAKHLSEAMANHGVSSDGINQAIAKVATLKSAVLYK
jgi:hemoglobin